MVVICPQNIEIPSPSSPPSPPPPLPLPLQMESLSPCSIDQRLSPLQQPPSGRGPSPYHQQAPPHQQMGGDIFSFNLPVSSHMLSSSQPPSMQRNPLNQGMGGMGGMGGPGMTGGPPNNVGPHPQHSGLQLFGNT